tara:strand:+ start:2965 stop:3213 length:249 start_codon:yes stop_codon:yes gene_type:complete
MDYKTKKLLEEVCTAWEDRVVELEVKEVGLLNDGQDSKANLVGMQTDTLRICSNTLRQAMLNLTRLDNHEKTIENLITNLTK